jgi:hypothetical protein
MMKMAAPTVTFQVERFGWTADDRLEVVGRWFGLRGHRFLRPSLDFEVGGRGRRLLALLEHKPWVADEGGEWVAAFAWKGDPVEFAEAELAVGPDLAVTLPPPAMPPPGPPRKRPAREGAARPRPRRPPTPEPERREAGPPRIQRLENELRAARAEVRRMADEIDRTRATQTTESMDLNGRLTAERQTVRQLTGELRAAREQLSAAEEGAARQLQQLRHAERALDAERSAREAAVADAERFERELEMARRERAAAEHEREAAVRARDRARQERNAWLSRARAAGTERQPVAPDEDLVERRPVRPR